MPETASLAAAEVPPTNTIQPTPFTENTMSAEPLNLEDLIQKPFTVVPQPESRLEQLHAQFAAAKAAADHANEIFDSVKAAIKFEAMQVAPEGEQRIDVRSQHGPALRLSYSETWRFDSKRFKTDNPEAYVRYAKKSGSWTLRPVAGGEV